jgi:hypothetical protein
MTRPSLFLAIAMIAAGCASGPGTSSPGPAESRLPSAVEASPIANATTTPLPSGGISEDQAVSIAQKAAPVSAVFESAEAGPFAVVVDRNVAEGLSLEPSREVWVVRFTATAAPCHVVPGAGPADPPNGEVCESPRPGTVTVVLDYFSGERFVTAGEYPKP